MVAGRPSPGLKPPVAVIELAAGRPVEAVWANEAGGLTFRLGEGPEAEFMKWCPRTSGIDARDELARLRWASSFVTVPQARAEGYDEESTFLLTGPIDGENAVSGRWLGEPRRAVTAIGAGLRGLHDALPVTQCPFSWMADVRLARVTEAHRAGALRPEDWDDAHRGLAIDQVLRVLADPPSIDKLVVCHGDACAPNTILAAVGNVAGHVDLGALGIADRWADLAVATWSPIWQYGPGFEQDLLDAYGVDADPVRTAYYRLLWDVSP
jgi:aminoglycoside phosphotransferase